MYRIYFKPFSVYQMAAYNRTHFDLHNISYWKHLNSNKHIRILKLENEIGYLKKMMMLS